MKKITTTTLKLTKPIATELILQVRISTQIHFSVPRCIRENQILLFTKNSEDVFELNLGMTQNLKEIRILYTTTFDFRNSKNDQGVINTSRIAYKLSTESKWTTIRPFSGLDPADIPAERLQSFYKYFKF